MPNSDAFILIGGRSSRLGVDKAFVEVGGRSLAKRAVDVVRSALPDTRITAVAGNETQFAIEAATLGLPFIFDLYPDRGPIGGLHAALANTRNPWIFLIACDYPFVTPDLINLLASKVSNDARAVVPEQKDGRLQPLCGFYNVRMARPVVDEIIQRPRPSPPMHEIAMELRPRVVRFDEYSHLPESDDFFININTVEDLNRARDRV
ncbi:MAG TPA: molybdenum cofactor guanylyltransferase [Pyrinomonadaceae bacterium]